MAYTWLMPSMKSSWSKGIDDRVTDDVRVPPECIHACFDTHCLHLGPVEVFRASGQLLEVDALLVTTHLPAVDLHDLGSGVFIGMGELYLAVESAGPEESGVQDVGTVGGRDDFDTVVRGEAVQLVE